MSGPRDAPVRGGLADQLRNPSGVTGRMAGAAMRVVNRQPNALAIQALGVGPAHDVLELGFGPGEGLRALERLAPHGLIYGVDQSATMLAQASARNRAAIKCGRIHLSLGRFEAIGLPDRSVDRILAVNVAYFWSDAAAVLAELDRVLRPGGRISLYVTDASTMARWSFSTAGHHRTFTASQLADFLADGPFEAGRIEVEQVTLPFGISGLVAAIGKKAGG
ncbi:MAG: class I SAM-dependent methyltransferase [Phenylobacterium sp.]